MTVCWESIAIISYLNMKPVIIELFELYYGPAGIRMFYDIEEQLTNAIKEQHMQLLIPNDERTFRPEIDRLSIHPKICTSPTFHELMKPFESVVKMAEPLAVSMMSRSRSLLARNASSALARSTAAQVRSATSPSSMISSTIQARGYT